MKSCMALLAVFEHSAAACRTHVISLPDSSVCECHFTIGVYIADLLEKWDVLHLEHKSIVKQIIPRAQYTNMVQRFPPRTEEQVTNVCLFNYC